MYTVYCILYAINSEKDHNFKLTQIPSSIATMKLSMATLLAVTFLICSGSPKPETKIIIHLDEAGLSQNQGQDYQGIAKSQA